MSGCCVLGAGQMGLVESGKEGHAWHADAAEEVFEDDYTLKFKQLVTRRGLLASFERDRARIDIGMMLNKLGTLELSGVKVWFQLKGIHATTVTAQKLAADG